MSVTSRSYAVEALAAFLLIALLGAFVGEYPRYILTMWLIYSLSAMGLNFIMGFGKLYALGHGGFMLVGAYITGVLINHFGWPPLATLPVAMVAAILLGVLIGLPAIRLKHFSLAIVTFAFASTIFQWVKSVDYLGGPQGLFITDSAFPQKKEMIVWILTNLMTCLSLIIWCNLRRSKTGRALLIISVNENVAKSFGVDIVFYKLSAFAFAGVLGSLSGCLLAMATSYIAPDTFNSELSILMFAAVMIGGRGKVLGPFLGAAFIVALPELTQETRNLAQLIYAVLFVLVVTFSPDGIVGLLTRLYESAFKRKLRLVASEGQSAEGTIK
jgi:branched-chain amino acid transport system permease protein